MRNTKHQIELNTMYNASAISKHLEEMAKKGWMPVKLNSLIWTYQRTEPQALHFAVTYDKNATEYDPAPTDSQLDYYDFAEHTGWKLAASYGQMQVFYNEQKDPIPLETEPAMEIDSIHEAARKSYLPGLAIMLLFSILMVLMQISSIVNYPIIFWSQTTSIVTLCALLMLLVLTSVDLIVYSTWHNKAVQNAEQGIFLPFPNVGIFNRIVLALAAALLIFWITSLLRYGSLFDIALACIILFYMIVLILIFIGVREILKRMKVSAKANRIVIFILFYIISLGGSRIVLFGIDAVQEKIDSAGSLYDADSMPVTIADLKGVSTDDYHYDITGTESILLSDKWYDQSPGQKNPDEENLPDVSDFSIRIIRVKAPVLYNTVFHSLYTDYSEDAQLSDTDETLWSANSALCLQDKTTDDGEDFNKNQDFILCYDDKIAAVSATWDLTDEQKEIIGETLASFR